MVRYRALALFSAGTLLAACQGRAPGADLLNLGPDAGPPPLCGNGTVDGDEECDNGPGNSDAVPDACRTDCRPARCGDNVADRGEECDALDLSHATCPDLGFTGGTLACNDRCGFDTAGCTVCGNGLCEPGETFETCPEDCQLPVVHAGLVHTCALLPDGSARCWGGNASSQLGDGQQHQTCGSTDCSLSPVPVSNLLDIGGLSVSSAHNCAVREDGPVWCWGRNWDGRLGSSTITYSPVPVPVMDLSDAIAVSTGGWFSCALLSGRTVRCWGDNEGGSLGNGTTEGSERPVEVSGLADAAAVSAGGFHSCALIADGTVRCWGSNSSGQLGDGQGGYPSFSAVPVSVVGIDDAVAVSAGTRHTCAVLSDGTVACWGENTDGQVGDRESFTESCCGIMTPAVVTEVSGAVAVSAGGAHTCALLSTTRVMCWGSNRSGQIGNGRTSWWMGGQSPALVRDLDDVIMVSAGGNHTCAVIVDGTVKCWGDNGYGQLGDGTTQLSETPVQVSGL